MFGPFDWAASGADTKTASRTRLMVGCLGGQLRTNRDLSLPHVRRVRAHGIGAGRSVIYLQQIRRNIQVVLLLQSSRIVDRHRVANELIEVADAPVVPRVDELRADELVGLMTVGAGRFVHG